MRLFSPWAGVVCYELVLLVLRERMVMTATANLSLSLFSPSLSRWHSTPAAGLMLMFLRSTLPDLLLLSCVKNDVSFNER